MENANVLEIKNLCKDYKTFSLKNVSFSVKKGSIMGFVGRNGAGKTTTLKAILNLVHPTSGTVKLFNKEFLTNEEEIKQKIGYASSGTNYYPRKTLKQIINAAKPFYKNWDDNICKEYMQKFELSENKKITELSEGMKVKFHLVLALSHNAEFLILDEPTSGLDPVSREELVIIFKNLAKQNVTILFSTHITGDLEKCADHITYIKKGEIIASSAMEDFLKSYAHEFNTLEDIMVHLELGEENR